MMRHLAVSCVAAVAVALAGCEPRPIAGDDGPALKVDVGAENANHTEGSDSEQQVRVDVGEGVNVDVTRPAATNDTEQDP